MTYLVTFYLDGDSVDDDCFPTLDEALSAKYVWQVEDESNHYADIQILDDRDRRFNIHLNYIDKLIKICTENLGAFFYDA